MKQSSLKLVYSRPYEVEQALISSKNAKETVDVISMMMPITSMFYFYKLNLRILNLSYNYLSGAYSSSTPQPLPPQKNKMHKQG